MVITLTGPTCSGKSTLEQELVRSLGWSKVTSFTTRKPRFGEVDGVHYYFLPSPPADEDVVEEIVYNGNYYGILKSEVQKSAGKMTIAVVEPQGAIMVADYCKSQNIPAFRVFVTQPIEVLIKRFLIRSSSDIIRDPLTADYNAKRLTALIEEHKDWPHIITYDAVISGTDLANQLINKLKKENVLND